MPRFFAVLAAVTLGGSLMALLLVGLKMLLRQKLPSTAYYYLWLLVLLRFVLPLPGIIPTPHTGAAALPAYTEQSPMRIYGKTAIPAFGGASEQRAESPETAMSADLPGNNPVSESGRPESPFTFTQLMIFIYIAGTVLRFAAYILGYLRFSAALGATLYAPGEHAQRLYSLQREKKKPELLCSDAVRTPMLLGLFSPVLVLPGKELSEEKLSNIFRHELLHYRRGDMLYKWFSVLVYSLQWFNPICLLVRRELNRACELSCDEMLISRMDREEKRSYGSTLISLASDGALPAGVIATTFATEKRDIKERLEQIMKHDNRKPGRIMALLLALVLLVGCGAVLGPQRAEADGSAPTPDYVLVTPENSGEGHDRPIRVTNVDELLAALGPDRQIWLEPGNYELDKAASYGGEGGEYYRWVKCWDGYELVIENVENMELSGMDEDGVEITALPRYANVLRFENCRNIMMNRLILGHDEEPGSCTGGVLYISGCDYMHINKSELYGCGIIGVWAHNSSKVFVTDCEIYDCSQSAVSATACYDVRVSDCEIYDCDAAWGGGIFEVESSTGFAVVNCEISDNVTQALLTSRYTQQAVFLGNEVDDCSFSDSLFIIDGYPVTVEGCSFGEKVFFDTFTKGYEGDKPVSPVNEQGTELGFRDIIRMEHREMPYEGPKQAESVALDITEGEDGRRHITVSSVDEFLAAIAPNTTITVEAERIDLSTAADYGSYGAQYYYWQNQYDGPELVITGVQGLSIIAEGVTFEAVPRYANVFSFINCGDIELSGFTAGHTQEPGACSGGVLNFQNCDSVRVSDCRLYGCGILGISAQGCRDFLVSGTEIYECSNGAVWLGTVDNFVFENCDIHDCAVPEFTLHDVRGVSYNGELLINGAYYFENGKLAEFDWEKYYGY